MDEPHTCIAYCPSCNIRLLSEAGRSNAERMISDFLRDYEVSSVEYVAPSREIVRFNPRPTRRRVRLAMITCVNPGCKPFAPAQRLLSGMEMVTANMRSRLYMHNVIDAGNCYRVVSTTYEYPPFTVVTIERCRDTNLKTKPVEWSHSSQHGVNVYCQLTATGDVSVTFAVIENHESLPQCLNQLSRLATRPPVGRQIQLPRELLTILDHRKDLIRDYPHPPSMCRYLWKADGTRCKLVVIGGLWLVITPRRRPIQWLYVDQAIPRPMVAEGELLPSGEFAPFAVVRDDTEVVFIRDPLKLPGVFADVAPPFIKLRRVYSTFEEISGSVPDVPQDGYLAVSTLSSVTYRIKHSPTIELVYSNCQLRDDDDAVWYGHVASLCEGDVVELSIHNTTDCEASEACLPTNILGVDLHLLIARLRQDRRKANPTSVVMQAAGTMMAMSMGSMPLSLSVRMDSELLREYTYREASIMCGMRGVVVDVGTNYGQGSTYLDTYLPSHGHLIRCEPEDGAYQSQLGRMKSSGYLVVDSATRLGPSIANPGRYYVHSTYQEVVRNLVAMNVRPICVIGSFSASYVEARDLRQVDTFIITGYTYDGIGPGEQIVYSDDLVINRLSEDSGMMKVGTREWYEPCMASSRLISVPHREFGAREVLDIAYTPDDIVPDVLERLRIWRT